MKKMHGRYYERNISERSLEDAEKPMDARLKEQRNDKKYKGDKKND